jgi:hypothetical protein
MSELTELPEWVWDLLDAVSRYEDEHPLLYRMTASDQYERTICFGGYLSEVKAWPPRAVQDAAEFRRQVLANATPAPGHLAGTNRTEETDHG